MKYRIAMLLKQHLIDYCKENNPGYSDRFELEYYAYNTLSELESLYYSLKDSYDGFITSGIIPHKLLTEIGRNDDVSFGCFRFDLENTYRILLEECVRRGSLDLSRVGIDFLPAGSSLAQVITANRLANAVAAFEKKVSLLSWKELDEFEAQLNQTYLERYWRGELDFIVTYFHSTVQVFQETPLDCYYLYPSTNEFLYVMRTMEQHIYQRKTQQSFPAVIRIDLSADIKNDFNQADLCAAELQRLLIEMVNRLNNNLSLKSGPYYSELYTDSKTLSQLTDQFHSCSLLPYLQKHMNFHGTIGYGIGSDFYSARSNALRAARFASEQSGGKSGSYLIDQNHLLTCLTGADDLEQRWVSSLPSDYVDSIAARAKLSSQTICKIIGVLVDEKSDQITSSELIDHLGISLRTANRYLSNLERSGLASVTGHRTIGGRGRPICIYQLHLDHKNPTSAPTPEKSGTGGSVKNTTSE